MTDLFSQLLDEHARTQRVTLALDAFVARLEDSPADLHEVIRFVTFFRGYADGLHHEREEKVLHRVLVLEGFSLDSGPLGHIRDQHQEGARLLLAFEMAASAPAGWGAAELAAIAVSARAYAAYERRHMEEEGSLLLPVAKREVLAHHAAEVLVAQERFARRREPRWNRPWLEQLGDVLVRAHAVG